MGFGKYNRNQNRSMLYRLSEAARRLPAGPTNPPPNPWMDAMNERRERLAFLVAENEVRPEAGPVCVVFESYHHRQITERAMLSAAQAELVERGQLVVSAFPWGWLPFPPEMLALGGRPKCEWCNPRITYALLPASKKEEARSIYDWAVSDVISINRPGVGG
jgi:hypothetical protein